MYSSSHDLNQQKYIIWFDQVTLADLSLVGGKNASLGEMISHLSEKGISVPDGFAISTDAYWDFIDYNNLRDAISGYFNDLKQKKIKLQDVGRVVRDLFLAGEVPPSLAQSISVAYKSLSDKSNTVSLSVAVRSSATAEDLPNASFAGQQESFLNIIGAENVIDSCKRCFASLFTDRAISYREEKGIDHLVVGLSAGVQKMVRSNIGAAGIQFTIDPETGFNNAMLINATWGLGEAIVQGQVTPDEYLVFKPLLSDEGVMPIIKKICGSKETKMVYSTDKGQSIKDG